MVVVRHINLWYNKFNDAIYYRERKIRMAEKLLKILYVFMAFVKLAQTTYIVLNGETKIQIVIGGVSLSAQNMY